MTPIDWYFDFVSPFAYLQLELLRREHPGVTLRPVPVVLGAILSHWGTIGPAELPTKRTFTYRFVLWQSRQLDIPLRFPPAHPFNSLAALRLAVATGAGIEAVTTIYRHIWRDGNAADTPESLASVAASLGIDDVATALADPSVKTILRANTEQAIARGVFGVPTLMAGDALFWGLDATGMALAVQVEPELLSPEAIGAADELPIGVQRAR
jgi:2-hydroxychromene-2-carboxylate isomerase